MEWQLQRGRVRPRMKLSRRRTKRSTAPRPRDATASKPHRLPGAAGQKRRSRPESKATRKSLCSTRTSGKMDCECGRVGTSGPGRHLKGGKHDARAGTFSQAPQAVRSARGRRWSRVSLAGARAGRTLHSDKCNTLGPTTDVHRLGNVSCTAAARAVLESHSFPSVALSFSPNRASRTKK